VHLIKQVEQVTISALEVPAWRFAGMPSMGLTNAVEIQTSGIWLAAQISMEVTTQ
jgi:hypothetical protein